MHQNAVLVYLKCHCSWYEVTLCTAGGGGGRSGTVGGRSPGCFLWVLPKRSIPKPDQHRKDILQESLGTYVIGTEEQQLHKISH